MRRHNLLIVLVLVAGLAACGDDDDGGGSGSGADTVNVYSSLPPQGAQRLQTRAMVNGIKLALEQAGGKAGGITVQ